MTIKECGKDNTEAVVLIHPSLTSWDYFMDVIPILKRDCHVLIPALPGYDFASDTQFISVEACASELADRLLAMGISRVKAVYGVSMGGSIALRMIQDGRVKADHIVMDGGITPYQLPRILTRFIALRDFAVVALGKLGGKKLMAKAFSSLEYDAEMLDYLDRMFRHCTYRTLWNTFDSCNNYAMPKETLRYDSRIHYWYGEKEAKARDWDIKYMKKFIPQTEFREFKGMDHGDLALFHAKTLADALKAL